MDNPFVSIVVGIRNEDKYISECIDSLLNLDYPKNRYEIFIVDGMSTDNTQNIVKQYPVKLLINERKNVAAARNIGVKNANGNLVAFTDGDCKVDKLWLNRLVIALEDAPEDVACVGGPNLVIDTDPTFARVVGYAQETLLGSGGSAQSHGYTKKQYVQSLPNCNSMYKKNVIEEVGYFDEYFVVGQDADLNHRISKDGYRFLYVPEAKVLHHRRGTIKSFSTRMFKYGAWMAELFRKHGDLVRWYSLLPPIAMIFAFVAILTSVKYIFFVKPLIYLILVYAILISITAIQVIYKMKSITGLLSLIILPTQHLMYGLGFLSKTLNIINKNRRGKLE